MKKIILSFLLLPSLIFATAEKEDFEFYKNVGEFYAQGIYYFDIDSDIESNSKKYLGDIRILNDGKEIKYKIKKDFDKYIKNSENINLKVVSKNKEEYIIDLGNNKKEEYLNSIFINTKSFDFRKIVNVKGADLKNGPYFNLNIEDKRGDLIYNLPEGADYSIDFKYSNYKFLKLTLSGGEENIKIDSFYKVKNTTEVISGEKDFLEIKGYNGVLKGNDQSIILDTKKDNLFFDQIKIKFSDKRFSRKYILYSSDKEKSEILESGKRFDSEKSYWVKISSGNFEKEIYTGDPVLTLKNNKRFYRLDIFNGDNKMLDFSGVIFEKFKRKIYFETPEGNSYLKIYYSSNRVLKPNYDFPFSEENVKKAKKIKISSQEENLDYIFEKKSIFDDNRWLMYLLVGIVMFVLGFFVYKIIKESGGKTDRDGMQI